MTEWKLRLGLLFAAGLLLSAGALGQTTTMTQTKGGELVLASEFFGAPDGREVAFILPDVSDFASAQTSQPYIVLTIGQVGGAGTLGSGNSTMITYTLNGATFAASAGGTDLRYFEGAGLGTGISVRVVGGGARGDRFVTYEVETTANIDAGAPTKALYFFPPNLQVSPIVLNPAETDPTAQVRGVTVVASIDGSGATVTSNPFPTDVLGSGTDPSTGAMVVNPLADGEILRLAPALTASLGMPEAVNEANVDIENRKVLADGVAVTMSGGQQTRGLKVGELSISLTPQASAPRVLRSANLTNVGGNLDPALGGTADVTVTGPFQQGDMVILGENRTSDSSKAFRMAGDAGPATVSVPIATMVAMNLVYLPGGVMDLRPGMFRASLALDFNDDLAASGPHASSSGTIKYQGITTQAYAHGVSRANDLEATSFLRVSCASVTPPATGCNIFLSCYGEDGAGYFGELTSAAVVPSGGTGVYSSGQIAGTLGGGWSEGGGRCDLLSNGVLEVQHMVRTSSLHLHNNSVVIGRTQRNSIAILRSGGGAIEEIPEVVAPSDPCLRPDPVDGCIRVDINPALDATRATRLLTDGRIYGPINIVRMFAGMEPLQASEIIALGIEFAFLERSGAVAPTSQVALSAPILASSVILLRGDIIYPSRALFRPGQGIIATSTGLVLSR